MRLFLLVTNMVTDYRNSKALQNNCRLQTNENIAFFVFLLEKERGGKRSEINDKRSPCQAQDLNLFVKLLSMFILKYFY